MIRFLEIRSWFICKLLSVIQEAAIEMAAKLMFNCVLPNERLGSLSKSLWLVLLQCIAAVTGNVWGENTYVLVVCQILAKRIQRYRKHELRSLKSLLFYSFSQPNGFAQRMMAVIHLAGTNRLFLSEGECQTLSTITACVAGSMARAK